VAWFVQTDVDLLLDRVAGFGKTILFKMLFLIN
jgi:hypothetical protein